MSAATNDIDTPERNGQVVNLPLAAGVLLYAGILVAVDASGNANPASDTAGLVVVGRSELHADNSYGSAGALSSPVKRGVFAFVNDTVNPLTAADIGQTIAYVLDNQTVTKAGTNHQIKAGLVIDVNTSAGIVWIDTRFAGAVLPPLTLTQDSLTDDSTGTAPAPVAGVVTVAAVTSVGTAANAISALIVELNKVKADLASVKALN